MVTPLGNLVWYKIFLPAWKKQFDPQRIARRMIWTEKIFELAKKKKDLKVEKLAGELIEKYLPKKESISKKVEEARQYYKKYKLIKGLAGYKGTVTGKVFYVKNPDKPPKIKNNRILVTSLTSPKLINHIKKSKAVVTDEGGLLSHAAIICRELNTPCVIGTKIATQVLKDGVKVEVDANKGVVTKLKK